MERIKKVFMIVHPFFFRDSYGKKAVSEKAEKHLIEYYKSMIDRVASDPTAVMYLELTSMHGKEAEELVKYAEKQLGNRLWNPKKGFGIFETNVRIFAGGEKYGVCPEAVAKEIAEKMSKHKIRAEVWNMPDIGLISLEDPTRGRMWHELSEEEKKRVLEKRNIGLPADKKYIQEMSVERGFSTIAPWKKRKKKR